MKKSIVSFVGIVAFAGGIAFAAESVTNGEAVVQKEKQRMSRTGGMLVKPNTMKGSLAIVNTQKKVTTKELGWVADRLHRDMRIDVRLMDGGKVDVSTVEKAKAALKSEVAVFIVDDPALPVSLVAYEAHWGIVNVAKLESAKPDPVLLYGRTKVETMRVVALVCGSGDSQYPGSTLSIGDKPEDLDAVNGALPIDAMNKMAVSLARINVTPAVYTSYRRACREGWAPQPTNDAQRAIWTEFHTTPTEPMKIKFDKAKGM